MSFAWSVILFCLDLLAIIYNKVLLLHMMCAILAMAFYFVLLAVLIRYLDLKVFK